MITFIIQHPVNNQTMSALKAQPCGRSPDSEAFLSGS
jgi:hypothetical protein